MTNLYEIPSVFEHYQEGSVRFGFLIKRIIPMSTLRSVIYELEHQQSGARILHIYNGDSENLFSVTFPTLPLNHTGVPHILEHVVLSGSKSYPVRDPFFEMVKMSMATFINAMTDIDHTMFPVCSNVKQDLFNLADVYFDAVFHPLLSETSFCREGFAYVPKDAEKPLGDLSVSGIVYSEMQGAYSSEEAQILNLIQQEVLSESPYRYDSGGNPEEIINLTYEQFKDFWQKHYHPSQGHFVFYGNIPTDEYLQFLEKRLEGYQRQPYYILPQGQSFWSQSKELVKTYTVEKDSDPLENKDYLTLHWLIGSRENANDEIDLDVVNQLLLGHEGAVLRKILTESELGQDISLSGDMDLGREKIFSLGLKGGKRENAEIFQKLCLESLQKLAISTFSTEEVETALNQIAYDVLEIESSYPLDLLEDVLSGWLYAEDPTLFLDHINQLKACRQRWKEDPRYFNRWIDKHLCKNQHRLLLTVIPDQEKQILIDKKISKQLDNLRQTLSDQQMLDLTQKAKQVTLEAGTANSQAQLATLPQLQLNCLPMKISDSKVEVENIGPVTFLFPEVFSNGLTYVILNFDLTNLPAHLWLFLPRFTDAIEKMGTTDYKYSTIASSLASVTDGVETMISFSKNAQNPEQGCYNLRIAFKCLDHQLNDALKLIEQLLFKLDPTDKKRLQHIVNQTYANTKTSLINGGHRTAAWYATRDFSESGILNWQVNGLPQLEYLKKIKNNFVTYQDELIQAIKDIQKFILNPYRLTISATTSQEMRKSLKEIISHWISLMENQNFSKQNKVVYDFIPFNHKRAEALCATTNVSHCVKAFYAPTMTCGFSSLLTLGTQFISQEFFLPELRFKGNAYGTSASYNPLQGMMMFSTFRDPHIVNTLKIFDSVKDYVQNADWSADDLRRTIIGTAKNYLFPIRPDNITTLTITRYTQGITPEIRQQNYEQLITTNVDQVKQIMLDLLDKYMEISTISVFSNKQKINKANQQLASQFNPILMIE